MDPQLLHREVLRVVGYQDQALGQGDGRDEEIGQSESPSMRRPIPTQEPCSFGNWSRDVVVLEAVQKCDSFFTFLRLHSGEDLRDRDGRARQEVAVFDEPLEKLSSAADSSEVVYEDGGIQRYVLTCACA